MRELPLEVTCGRVTAEIRGALSSPAVKPTRGTRWSVTRRRYVLDLWDVGVAEKVRAERRDQVAWVRVLEAVYWWPEHEGREWPALVVPAPQWSGIGAEPDTWAHFEEVLGFHDRYTWEVISDTNGDRPPA